MLIVYSWVSPGSCARTVSRTPGLDVADGRVERVDDVQHAYTPDRVSQPHGSKLTAGRIERVEGERGCRVARLERSADDGELFAKLVGSAAPPLRLDT